MKRKQRDPPQPPLPFTPAIVAARHKTVLRAGEMSDEPQYCWGDCGHWLVLKRLGQGRRRWDAAFQLCTDKGHTCPRSRDLPLLFLPGMRQCHEPIECNISHKQIYGVPMRPKNTEEEVIWFDKLDWPWVAHFCPKHNSLAGIADISPKNLSDKCSKLKLSEPFRLVIIICVEDLSSPEALTAKNIPSCAPICKMPIRGQLYVVALKSVLGENFCCFFHGDENPRWGDLAALCGYGVEQRLLTNSGHVLSFDGQAEPSKLGLSWHPGSKTRECSACRRKLAES
jgi:hypothetical protein